MRNPLPVCTLLIRSQDMKSFPRYPKTSATLLFIVIVLPSGTFFVTLRLLLLLSRSSSVPVQSSTSIWFSNDALQFFPPSLCSVSAILMLPVPLSGKLLVSDIATNELYLVEANAPILIVPLLKNAGGAPPNMSAGVLRRPGVAGMSHYKTSRYHVRVALARNAARDVALLTLSSQTSNSSLVPHVESVITVASAFNGSKLNSPHSIHVDGDGNLFFSDPTFGLISAADDFDRGLDAPNMMEQASQNVYYIPALHIIDSISTGLPTSPVLLVENLDRPTGLGVVDDRLFITTSSPRKPQLVEYKLIKEADGTLRVSDNRRVIYDWSKELHRWGQTGFSGVSSHLCVIDNRWLFVGSGNGVAVFDVLNRSDTFVEPTDWIAVDRPPGPPSVVPGVKNQLYIAASDKIASLKTGMFAKSAAK